MSCCHADFALTDSSDRAFTVGMPTFTFGAGCLAEAGEQALEHGLKRVALIAGAGELEDAELHFCSAAAVEELDLVVLDERVREELLAHRLKLRGILEAEGLEGIDSIGQPFDPRKHEAVAHVPSEEPEGTVIQEHQKAYRLHDRVIRPALVTVSSGSEGKEKN